MAEGSSKTDNGEMPGWLIGQIRAAGYDPNDVSEYEWTDDPSGTRHVSIKVMPKPEDIMVKFSVMPYEGD